MQPFARDGLTAEQVQALIRDAPDIRMAAGLELLDIDLNVLEDVTDHFEGGTVSRASYDTLHGTAKLRIAAELDWGTAIVRPYLTMTGTTTAHGALTARFNLGAYLTSAPKTDLSANPVTHDVDGFDLLHWLNTPVGEAYVAEAGNTYLAEVEQILTTQGISQYQVDQAAAGVTLANNMVWPFHDSTTWLNIINDLLAAVGYQGMWSDWDGRLRAQPYILPTDRAAEWYYTASGAQAMLAPKRVVTRDYFDAPNRWVFYWAKDPAGAQPVEGNGIYTYVNETTGPTSVAARGRVISAKPVQIDVADQASLVAAAQQRIEADLRLKTSIEVETFPNPLHWHFDRVAIADPAFGPIADGLAVRWTLPLSGGDMQHEWSLV